MKKLNVTKEELAELLNQGLSSNKIAKKYGVSGPCIRE